MIVWRKALFPMIDNRNTKPRLQSFPTPKVAILVSLSLAALAAAPSRLAAEQHVVPRSELQRQILTTQQTRQDQVRHVREFFSSGAVQEGLRSAGLDAKQIHDAVSMLDDAELARLADRTRSIDNDLKAGALSNEHLTYIVIALATAVIVILAT
jgi:hypothetical protein